MLKTRIITALCIIPFLFLGIFFLPPVWFAVASAAMLLLAGWEWARLIGFSSNMGVIYLIGLLLSFIIIVLIPPVPILLLSLLTWFGITYYLCHYEKFKLLWKSKYLRAATGVWIFAIAWYALNIIRGQHLGAMYLSFLFFWIWGADSGAYFVGRAYGRNKLAPEISPGKSKEGFVGGVFATTLIAAISGMFLCKSIGYNLLFLLLAIAIACVSVVGDLFESMVKRQAGVKDSGQLLPGHGGMLDRLDSLLSAAPIFALGLTLLTGF